MKNANPVVQTGVFFYGALSVAALANIKNS